MGLQRLVKSLTASSDFVIDGGVGQLWLNHFAEGLRQEGKPPPDKLGRHFDYNLGRFLQTPSGEIMGASGVLIQRNSTMVATVIRVLAVDYTERQMLSLRALIANSGLGHAGFSFSFADIYHEQNAIMVPYTAQNLMWMIAAVVGAVFVLSLDAVFTAAMCTCILSCCTF